MEGEGEREGKRSIRTVFHLVPRVPSFGSSITRTRLVSAPDPRAWHSLAKN